MKMTQKAIERIRSTASEYNFRTKKLASGIYTDEDKKYAEEYYNNLVSMIDILHDMEVDIDDNYEVIERYEAIVSTITSEGEVIFDKDTIYF